MNNKLTIKEYNEFLQKYNIFCTEYPDNVNLSGRRKYIHICLLCKHKFKDKYKSIVNNPECPNCLGVVNPTVIYDINDNTNIEILPKHIKKFENRYKCYKCKRVFTPNEFIIKCPICNR